MALFSRISSQLYLLHRSAMMQPNSNSVNSKMPTLKIALAITLLSGFAAASAKPLVCTTEVRHYCTLSNECDANKDVSPSSYKIEFKSPRKIQVKKYIGNKLSSSWNAVTTNSKLTYEMVFFEVDGAFTTLTLSTEKKSFVLTLHNTTGNQPTSQIELGFCRETD